MYFAIHWRCRLCVWTSILPTWPKASDSNVASIKHDSGLQQAMVGMQHSSPACSTAHNPPLSPTRPYPISAYMDPICDHHQHYQLATPAF